MRRFGILSALLLTLGALGAPLQTTDEPRYWAMPGGQGYCIYRGAESLLCYPSAATSATVQPTPTLSADTRTPTPTVTATVTRTPAPSPTATAAPPMVVNGGFENGLAGWTQFTLAGSAELNSERVSTGADPLAVHGGDASARLIAHYACYRSGVYQVFGVPVGAHVRVSAWVMTLGSRADGLHAPEPNMNSYAGIGLDPLGLTSASVSRIEWSRIVAGQLVGATHGLDPSWQQMSVETITTRPTLTVFIYADLGKTQDGACMWAYYSLLGFVDDVSVEVLP